MKLAFYFDIWPGMDVNSIYPTKHPSEKYSNTKRYKVEVEVPDSELFQVDSVIKPISTNQV